MILVKRYILKPTKEQEQKMLHTLWLCRKLYNHALEQRQIHYKEHGTGLTYRDQQNQLPIFKKDHPEYKEVHSQVLQDVLRRLDTAFQNFFDKRTRYPKFKDKFHYTSFTYPQVEAKRNFDSEGFVYLPKIGTVKMNVHQPFDPVRVKTINVKYLNGVWYVNFAQEVDEEEPKDIYQNCVGIDLGIKYLLTTSDGLTYENPKWLEQSGKKLARLQRQLSRKTKGSKNREKAKEKVQKLHEKVANQRKDFLHKVSLEIVRNYDMICIEDLQTSNMMKNHRLAKSIANVSWSKLTEYLEYKSRLYGKKFVKVNPQYTSQKCSSCGTMVPKTLSVRVHKCPECGCTLDRDHNAAINILNEGKLIAA